MRYKQCANLTNFLRRFSVVPQTRDEGCTKTEKESGYNAMQALTNTRLHAHDYELKRARSASACQFSRDPTKTFEQF